MIWPPWSTEPAKVGQGKLVDDFDFNASRETTFCESCVEGKHHRSRFPVDGGKRSSEPLGLVHSDVSGKMNATSLRGGEYFLTFIDDNTLLHLDICPESQG